MILILRVEPVPQRVPALFDKELSSSVVEQLVELADDELVLDNRKDSAEEGENKDSCNNAERENWRHFPRTDNHLFNRF